MKTLSLFLAALLLGISGIASAVPVIKISAMEGSSISDATFSNRKQASHTSERGSFSATAVSSRTAEHRAATKPATDQNANDRSAIPGPATGMLMLLAFGAVAYQSGRRNNSAGTFKL